MMLVGCVHGCAEQIDKLEADISKLQKALEFYADELSYRADPFSRFSLIDGDEGWRAREALDIEENR